MEEIREDNGTVSKDQAYVSFFFHENAMMHKDMDNERIHKTLIVMCVTFVLLILIFVTGYTIRTKIWLETITRMNDTIVEVTNAKEGASPTVRESAD